MPTYQADKVVATVMEREGLGITSVTAEYDLAGVTAFTVNDVIEMVKVPPGVTVLDVTVSSDDLDTNGTPTIVLDVGDDGNTDRFIDGSTIAQGGGLARLSEHGGHGYEYTAENTIDIFVQVAGATPTTVGTLKCTAIYTNDA